jgi:uncharacterized protein
MSQLDRMLASAESLVARLERLLPPTPVEPDWDKTIAFRWRGRQHSESPDASCRLQPIRRPCTLSLADMQCIEYQ